jgi:hypothetical protein
MTRLGVSLAAVLLSAGPVFAQTAIEITPEQETTIYSTLSRGATVGAAPADVTLSVGAELPASVELREVPASIEVPAVQRYRYAVVGGRVVLVEPQSRKVVRVIERR